MTVKDLIIQLQELDQDKGIWVEYDSIAIFPPIPDSTLTYITREDERKGAKLGDYVITAG